MVARSTATARKQTALQLAAKVNAALGAGSIVMADDPSLIVELLPTGVLEFDCLLNGGLPRGRFTEIFGDYSSLKSFIGLKAIAETQQGGGVCALIDTEHAFDPSWAEQLGVDTKSLLLPFHKQRRVVTGEEAVDVTQALVANDVDLVVWDSVAATFPQDEAKKRLSTENIQPARLAALMSQAMRRINAVNHKTAVLCINQTRMKVGMVFGSPESIPGGKALPFYASYRVALRKAGKVTENRQVWDGKAMATARTTLTQSIRAELLKSKLSSPDREVYMTWDLKVGQLDTITFLIAVGLEHGLIKMTKTKGKATTWKMGTTSKTGDAAFRGWLDSNTKMKSKLRELAVSGGSQSLGARSGV